MTIDGSAKRPWFRSKKFWAMILGVGSIVFPALATGGTTLPVALGVVGPVCAYILAQGRVDEAEAHRGD